MRKNNVVGIRGLLILSFWMACGIVPRVASAADPEEALTISSDTVWGEGDYRYGSLTVANGATLTIAGGSVVTVSGELAVSGNAKIVLQGKSLNQVNGQWVGTGVTINAGSMNIDTSATITADGQGYGPGGGPGGVGGMQNCGGTHGGVGGQGAWGSVNPAVYGSWAEPAEPGSGGGGYDALGGGTGASGGGVIRLNVTGTLLLNGEISADGQTANWDRGAGAGAGGSIWATVGTLAGAGRFTAEGGGSPFLRGGVGGGGRIAVYYNANQSFGGFDASSAAAGAGRAPGGTGSTIFVDRSANHLRIFQNAEVPADASVSYDAVTLDKQATLALGGGSTLSVSGDLRLTSHSTIVILGKNRSGQVGGKWAGSGGTILAANLTVDAGSTITANGQGYLGGKANNHGMGPGSVADGCNAGATYGGVGGNGNWGQPNATLYGSPTEPVELGSGGGGYDSLGGGIGSDGGGAIRLVVKGKLKLDGVISADGQDCTTDRGAGAGSGGSIWARVGTLAGAGRFTAAGGGSLYKRGGGGGGGRIAVYYDASQSFGGFKASTAKGGPGRFAGAPGTVGFFDCAIANQHLYIYENFTFGTDAQPRFGALTLREAATMGLKGGAKLSLDGGFTMTSGSLVTVFSKNTDAAPEDGRWAGEGSTINAGDVTIARHARITADGQGYAGGQGPAAAPGGSNAGGTHGGVGGNGHWGSASPMTYGDEAVPTELGSGGGDYDALGGGYGSAGGGAIRINASGVLTLNGEISANGQDCTWDRGAGAGAGGSVCIQAVRFDGAGQITARGGNGYGGKGGGGGGGRVALYGTTPGTLPAANITAPGGTGKNAGAAGTVVFPNALRLRWAPPVEKLFHDVETLAWDPLGVNLGTTLVDITATGGGVAHPVATGVAPLATCDWDTRRVPDGIYLLRAKFRHAATAQAVGEITREVTVNNSAVWHGGRLAASETWSANFVHIVETTVYVPEGVTLVIEPGTVVKFAPGAGIVIEKNGRLEAPAAANAPIHFTSLYDDSVGGDTNLDGGRTQGGPGQWAGFFPQDGSQVNLGENARLLYSRLNHAGTVTASQTWSGALLHVITENLTIPNGVSVTLEAGAIVKFERFKGITIEPGGKLIAKGQAARPIVFTSIRDDGFGGDTNGDAARSRPAAGDWRWIRVNGGTAQFDHAYITYGGGNNSGGWDSTGALRTDGDSSLTLTRSVLRESFYDGVLPFGGRVLLASSVLTGCDRALNPQTGSTMSVINCTLDGHRIGVFQHGSALELVNCSITNCAESGISYISGSQTIRNCNVWAPPAGGYANYRTLTDATGKDGNISKDPDYRGVMDEDTRPRYQSPLIDAGDGARAWPSDIMDAPRYDDPRTPNLGTAAPGGAFADIGAHEFVETARSGVDLIVSSVSGPASVMAGQKAEIQWQVRNIGVEPVQGAWHDTLALVSDVNTTPTVETKIDDVISTGILGPGQSAVFTAQVRIPGGTEGACHWKVRTNSRGEIFEGANSENNEGYSLDPARLLLPELKPGSPLQGLYDAGGQPAWFKVAQVAGQDLAVLLDSGSTAGSCVIYAGFGRMPSPERFELRSSNWNTPDARLGIPAPAAARTVYLLVVPRGIAPESRQFTLEARAAGFALDALGLSEAGNAGRVTVPLLGSRFGQGLAARLQPAAGGGPIAAGAVVPVDSTLAMASFDLRGAPAGVYHVIVRQDGVERTLSNAFTIVAGRGGRLEARLLLPQAVREGRPFKGTVEYANTGDADLPAPILIVEGGATHPVWAEGDARSDNTTLQILAVATDGPSSGTLRPGERYSVPFNTVAVASDVEYNLWIKPGDSTDPVDWTAFEAQIRPDNPGPGWNAAWAAVRERIGSTYGDYRRAMALMADELRRHGRGSNLVYNLLFQSIRRELFAPQGSNARGRIYLNDTAHPLGRRAVLFENVSTGEQKSAYSWFDGVFGTTLAPGAWRVSVDGCQPSPWGVINVPATGALWPLEIVVNPGATLTGRVIDDSTGAPVAGAQVILRSLASGELFSAATEGNGYFTIQGLPGGSFEARATADSFIAPRSQEITLAAGQPQTMLFRVATGGTIAGRVLSPGGQPVKGARVKAFGGGNATGKEATSDESGNYQLAGLPPGTYGLIATAGGYGVALREGVAIEDRLARKTVELKLAVASRIEGFVLDAGGQPIGGASVFLKSPGPGAVERPAVTSAAGGFGLAGLAAGEATLLVAAPDFKDREVKVTLAAGQTKTVTINLARYGQIAGTVRMNGGAALAGVPVTLVSPLGLPLAAVSSATGNFTFGGLPDGKYTVGVGKNEGLFIGRQEVAIDEAHPTASLTLALDAGEIVGTVRGAGGSPLAGLPVGLAAGGRLVARGVSDAQGRYHFLAFKAGAYEAIALGGGSGFSRAAAQVVLGQTTQADLSLGVASSLRVTVSAAGQAALQGATVILKPSAVEGLPAGQMLTQITGTTGTVTFVNLAPGIYQVEARARGLASAAQTVALGGGGGTLAMTLESGRSILVRLSDGQQKPAAGAHLILTELASGRAYFASTDGAGLASFDMLPGGDFELWATDLKHGPAVRRGLSTASALGQSVELSLDAGAARLKGVLLADGGTSVAAALVGLVTPDGSPILTTLSGLDGRFEFSRPIPAGKALLRVESAGLAPVVHEVNMPAAGTVSETIAVGAPLALAIDVQGAGGGSKAALRTGMQRAPGEDGSIAQYISLIMNSWMAKLAEPERAPFDTDDWRNQTFKVPFEKLQWMAEKCPTAWDAYWRADKSASLVSQQYFNWVDCHNSVGKRRLEELGYAATQAALLYMKTLTAWRALNGQLSAMVNTANSATMITPEAIGNIQSLISLLGNIQTDIMAGQFDDLSARFDGVGIALNTLGSLASSGKFYNGYGYAGQAIGLISLVNDYYNSAKDIFVTMPNTLRDLVNGYNNARDSYYQALLCHKKRLAQLQKAIDDCLKMKNPPKPDKPQPGDKKKPSVGKGADPNDKVTVGYGDKGYVTPGTPLLYTIRFENMPTATLPAFRVVVTDPLSAKLDWSTVELLSIGFNGVTLHIPRGLKSYETEARVASDPNPVRVKAELDPGTGVLAWLLESRDPVTGDIPEDPLSGFLPPNNATHRGEGFVTFTVRPKKGLASGEAIENKARIVFDYNAPIDTPPVTNTIDDSLPASNVAALPALVDSPDFTVNWNAADGPGSGISGVDVYVSIDGGPFQLWLQGTSATSAVWHGAAGHLYQFYTVSRDYLDTIEPIPANPDATIGIRCTFQQVVDHLLGRPELSAIRKPLADFNGDQKVDAADLVYYGTSMKPAQPATPNPAGGAASVALTAKLDWADSARADSYDLYFWPASQAKPAAPTAAGLTVSVFDPPGNLAYETAYRWQVIAKNRYGVTAGPIWAFTAEPYPVKLVSPNGGQTWKMGATAQIQWKFVKSVAGTKALFQLWRNGKFVANLAPSGSSTTGQATSTITVPKGLTAASNYKVRVISDLMKQKGLPNSWDESDGTITLKAN